MPPIVPLIVVLHVNYTSSEWAHLIFSVAVLSAVASDADPQALAATVTAALPGTPKWPTSLEVQHNETTGTVLLTGTVEGMDPDPLGENEGPDELEEIEQRLCEALDKGGWLATPLDHALSHSKANELMLEVEHEMHHGWAFAWGQLQATHEARLLDQALTVPTAPGARARL